VAQAEQFRPQKLAQDFPRDFGKESEQFARDFELLADLIEDAGSDSEAFALYVSTCRNAYLTINGMFYDIREIFGRISPPHGIFGALQEGQAYAFAAAGRHLDDVGLLLSALEEKRVCWHRREELHKVLEELLGKLSHLDRQTLDETLNNVVDQDDRSNLASVRQFIAFDSAETDTQRSLMHKLVVTSQKLRRVRDCMIRVKALGEELKQIGTAQSAEDQQGSLFRELGLPPLVKQKAIEFYDWFQSGHEDPEMGIVNQALVEVGSGGHSITNTLSAGESAQDITEVLSIICERLQAVVGKEYTDLAKSFRPNIGQSPLPRVFLIDLSDQLPPKPESHRAVAVTPIAFSRPPIDKLVIAIAQPPSSSSVISLARVRYDNEEARQIAADWAILAVKEAVAESKLIVFSELFVPEFALASILEVAKKHQIGVVCGMEGTWTDGRFSNYARVFIPGAYQDYQQYKKYPSNSEPESFYTKGGQLCFLQSSIGSFSVIICSDLREFDVIAAIECQPFLDYLVVCCCNPYVDLWETLAIADAARLHCFVIICNWSENSDANGYGQGSLCASPARKAGTSPKAEPRIKPVSLIKGAKTFNGSLQLHELDISALLRDRAKPKTGFLSPPHRRLHINLQ
jgi:predicted amidohydrolase